MEVLSLGEKIKKLRKEKNMTLKELAGDRITAAQISHIERDKSHTSYELLEYLSRQLGVSVEYLLENKEVQSKKMTDNLLLKAEVCLNAKKLVDAELCVNEAIDLCEKFNLLNNFSRGWFLLAQINLANNELNKAIINFERALFYFVKVDNIEWIYKCYFNIGVSFVKQNLYSAALINLKLAEEKIDQLEIIDFQTKRSLFSNISLCYMKLNEPTESLKYIEKVNEIEAKFNIEEIEIMLLKANNMTQIGEIDKSKKILNKALELTKKEKKEKSLSDVYLGIAEVYNCIGNLDKTIEYSEKAYSLKLNLNEDDAIDEVFKLIDFYSKKKDYTSAKKYCKKTLASSIKCKNKLIEGNILKKYSFICMQEGDINIAIEYLIKGVEIAIVLEDKKLLADLYVDLAKIYANISKEKELEYYEKSMDLYEELEII